MNQRPDFSCLSSQDVFDLALQRTSVLMRLPRLGAPSYRAWAAGYTSPLRIESRLNRARILRLCWDEANSEAATLSPFLQRLQGPPQICDIGCGHAFIDLALGRSHPGASFHLIDIEHTDSRHHDYHDVGAGYANLNQARRFLEANGIPAAQVSLTNPLKDPLPSGPFDLVFSTLSAGFHYPVSEYAAFAHRTLAVGGTFVFDMRSGTGQESELAAFSQVEVVAQHPKSTRLAAIK